MKHKTSDLEGALLDAAVARCVESDLVTFQNGLVIRKIAGGQEVAHWAPSSVWSCGGPIIERERIYLFPQLGPGWQARLESDSDLPHEGFGPTPLIAAMRAYVASKLGEEIEL